MIILLGDNIACLSDGGDNITCLSGNNGKTIYLPDNSGDITYLSDSNDNIICLSVPSKTVNKLKNIITDDEKNIENCETG
ncbi:hypothetical protein X798_02368 [Onchocerca flexuosa]|uniref:Uncharacterized protein n=1 Tax=Onchocerca flexuosa TaxID=387005 RepID=A0A238BZI5_9BILA|nr:hypothetical protein X798_02368 [Onchocerca flexuosa]